MTPFAELIQQGAAHAWLFIPSAILLGALHGLEPGHSKTMMAAFIVAIRGTVMQAVLLGLAATVSHTMVVWGIAFGGMYLWRGVAAESFEPYLQLVSAVIIIAMALWMLWRTWEDQKAGLAAAGHEHGHHHHAHTDGGHAHDHGHAHEHGHSHAPPHAAERRHGQVHAHGVHAHSHEVMIAERDHGHGDVRRIDTGHGLVAVEIFEDGVPPRWRVRTERGETWSAGDVVIETERPDGARQKFSFVQRGGFLESSDEVPEPHEFMVRVSLGHRGHTHDYDLSFLEGEGHDHMHEEVRGLEVATDGYQDAHELAHANDIRRRFADRKATTWQIILFGLTGGLIPCPAAITVLLLCLQLQEFTLGFALVLCFSIGLAITLVSVGAAAALSVRHATQRWTWFSTLARRAPYASGVLIIAVGLYVGYHGWVGLEAMAQASPT
jgi:nickel/cobalt exporter